MNSLPIRVGLVDMTGTIDPAVMAQVAAALNTQVTRDLPQYWNVLATVTYLPHKDEIPQGVWPVQIVKTLPRRTREDSISQNTTSPTPR